MRGAISVRKLEHLKQVTTFFNMNVVRHLLILPLQKRHASRFVLSTYVVETEKRLLTASLS